MSFGVYLYKAKRGKGVLAFADWAVWNPITGKEANSDLPPPVAWLAVFLTTYQPAKYSPDLKSSARLLVSRHAIIRLAQRANVRTVNDLITALRDLWAKTFKLIEGSIGSDSDWLEPDKGGAWRIPLATGQIAVLEPDKGGAWRLVVKTILDPGMVDDDALGGAK